MNGTSTQDRLRGMLVGLAVGDALGAPVEFMPPGSFAPVTGMQAGGPHRLPAGYWTDDTSLALCSGISLLVRHGFDAEDQIQRFLRWYRQGYLSSTGRCFDIGNRTAEALRRYVQTGACFAAEESFDSAGNGALMRLAPVVIHSHRDPPRAVELAQQHSRLTHADPRCLQANAVFAQLLLAALSASTQAQLWQSLEAVDLSHIDYELGLVLAGSFRTRQPPAIRGTGYVIDSLEAALWAFAHSDSFEQGALLAVNLGEDADTTAAVYGQLAGAFYGYSAIPAAWRAQLHCAAPIRALADALAGYEHPPLPENWY